MKVKIYDKISRELKKEVNFDEVKDVVITNPLQRISDDYSSVDVGGLNLTIGEMVESAKKQNLGFKQKRISIIDYRYGEVYDVEL